MNIFFYRYCIRMFSRAFRLLLFQVLMDIVLETNDAVRRTYLQFTRNVALAQLQRPIGYRFTGVMATFCYYTSYTLLYTWRQLSATGAVDDGHCMQYAHSYPNFHIEWNVRLVSPPKKETPMLNFCMSCNISFTRRIMIHFAAYYIIHYICMYSHYN